MKGMTWMPEDAEQNQKVAQYLDSINHAPYMSIMAIALVLFCLFTSVVLLGIV